MSTNIFGLVLAGGMGTRMGNVEKPKQFLTIGGKPIIIHTIEKFVINSRFEKILVLVPTQWMNYTKDIVKKHISMSDKVQVVEGGSIRNDTIMNGINYIDENYTLNDETVIVTHDSVRPFVTHRIIEENIEGAIMYGSTDTVIPATDTIIESIDNNVIEKIPNRNNMYQGQTPQSFRAKELRVCYENLSDEAKSSLSDACKIMLINGKPVHLIMGDESNMKITHPHDLKIAEAILGGEK